MAEGCLHGCKVLPHITVSFGLYKVDANKKALVHKEKTRFPLSCTANKQLEAFKKEVWILVESLYPLLVE